MTCSQGVRDTVGNEQWLRRHEPQIRAMLPDTWTHMENINILQLAFRMKLLGIDWRSTDEFGQVMLFLEKLGMLQRQNRYQVRANPGSVFPP